MNKKNARKKTNQPLEETAPASSMPLRRKRGRPRKNPLPETPATEAAVATEPDAPEPTTTAEPGPEAIVPEPPRKKRGRPRKKPQPEAPAT